MRVELAGSTVWLILRLNPWTWRYLSIDLCQLIFWVFVFGYNSLLIQGSPQAHEDCVYLNGMERAFAYSQ